MYTMTGPESITLPCFSSIRVFRVDLKLVLDACI